MSDSSRQLDAKERAKLARRAAYQKAKAAREADPKYQALKQAAKEQRRAEYQRQKERRKAERLQEKRARELAADELRATERARADAELLKLITWVSKGSSAKN